MNKVILGIFAHPDDAEFSCTGTLSLFHKKAGWDVHIATLASGDKGTAEHTQGEISRIRKSEATRSASLLNGTYHCLDFEDVYIFYNRESINKTTALLRRIAPDIVITHNPVDYMVDHEVTSQIVRTACFAVGMKNLDVDETPLESVPHLYYSDVMEGKDHFGKRISMGIHVNISEVIEVKEKMLKCHASQRNWLRAYHKMDEYVLSMKNNAIARGKECNTDYAEGFNQHLGHGYPQTNLFKEILGDLVTINNE